MLLMLLTVCYIGSSFASHDLRIHNKCSEEIWIGLLGNSIPDGGGFALAAGQSHTSVVDNNWSGRVWGRTHCSGDRCETGDCGRGLQCAGAGGAPPATLAEITFDAGDGTQDFYDVSLVDGYNIQLSMNPVPGTYREGSGHYYCGRAGCDTDLNAICPTDLQMIKEGRVIACQSACLHFNTDEFCCRGSHDTPATCPPFAYSQTFKRACPEAYSYAYDDEASTFTCNGNGSGQTAYDITFCG